MKKIKKNDEIIIKIGKDRGKRGKILKVISENKVVVEGVNIIKKAIKANQKSGVQGGIVEIEQPIHISNVCLYNHETNNNDKIRFSTDNKNKKIRVFKTNNKIIDK